MSKQTKSYMPQPDPPSLWGDVLPYSAKVERFIEWVAGHAYRDIRGKYRIYRMGIKTTLNSLDEVWEWWDNNIENK